MRVRLVHLYVETPRSMIRLLNCSEISGVLCQNLILTRVWGGLNIFYLFFAILGVFSLFSGLVYNVWHFDFCGLLFSV